ncbi:MAG: iron-containing alcohol dehydrogenase [Sedimentisphaerales bacterium]
MLNFTYCNPVNIVFGKGTISQLSLLIDPKAKILLTYGGGSIIKNGVYRQVKNALKKHNVVEFGGIEPNPVYETLMKAVELGRKKKIDFILAVGGGSVLDGSKFIAAAIPYKGKDCWKILQTHGAVVQSALPLGDVLTLPATGSEMNPVAVISRKSTAEKLFFGSPLVYPVFSILDPQTTYSLPKNQLRNGLVDAFVHVIEQYLTVDLNTPVQDGFAETILKTLVDIAPVIMSGKKDYSVRATFMWAATQALNGILSRGVIEDWSTHMIGHEVTAFFGLAHAETLAILLPAVWKYEFRTKTDKLAMMAQNVWGIKKGSKKQKAAAAIDRTVKFFHSINMPTRLRDFGITQKDVQKVVNRFTQTGDILGENKDIGAKAVRKILNMCL